MPASHVQDSAGALVLVSRRLPEGGLEALLNRPMASLVNAMRAYTPPADAVARLPLEAVVMAPNSAAFLASLGKPLAIARDLESAPGVWHLGTVDGRHEWVVFSDCHRKNSWKGGQVCAVRRRGQDLPPEGSTNRLCEAFATVWGGAGRGHAPSAFHWLAWFEQQAQQLGRAPEWPRAAGFVGRDGPAGAGERIRPRPRRS